MQRSSVNLLLVLLLLLLLLLRSDRFELEVQVMTDWVAVVVRALIVVSGPDEVGNILFTHHVELLLHHQTGFVGFHSRKFVCYYKEAIAEAILI